MVDVGPSGEVEEAERDRDGGEEEVEGVAEEAVLGEADVVPEGGEGVEEGGGVGVAAIALEDADEGDDRAVGDDVKGHEGGCEEEAAGDAVAGGEEDAAAGGGGGGANGPAEPDGEQCADSDPH